MNLKNIYSVIGNAESFQTQLLLDLMHAVLTLFPTFDDASKHTVAIVPYITFLKLNCCFRWVNTGVIEFFKDNIL